MMVDNVGLTPVPPLEATHVQIGFIRPEFFYQMERWTPKTIKQWRFAHEFCVDYDAKAAAIRAGYREKGAQQAAYYLLKKPKVQAIIDEHKAAVKASCVIRRDKVIEQLQRIAFARASDFMTLNGNGSLRFKTKEEIGTGPETAVIKLLKSNARGQTIGLELEDKMTALETLLEMSKPFEESREQPRHEAKCVPDPVSALKLTAEP